MKKKILISLSVVIVIVYILFNVGIQIGSFKIGWQNDEIQTSQKYGIKNSEFAKQYLQNGQISVINLWASWCKPCVEELPILKKLKRDYPECKFAMLSIDKNEEDLNNGIKKFKIENDITLENRYYRKAIRNFLENRDLKSLISTEIVPITYFIKNGKVVNKLEGSIDEKEAASLINSLK